MVELSERNILIGLSMIAVIAAIVSTNTLSSLDFDSNCEWTDTINGQSFDSLEQLEAEVGQEAIEKTRDSPDHGIRETEDGVEFKRCTIQG